MGVKSAVLAGLFLPLLVPLLLVVPLADSVTKCLLPYHPIPAKCLEKEPSACATVKCTHGMDVNGCIPVKGRNRKDYCLELSEKYCHGQMKEDGPSACQICTTDLCNTGDLVDGGDWDNVETSSSSTGKFDEENKDGGGGHFGFNVNWLLLFAGFGR